MNNLSTTTTQDLKKFIESESFKILVIAGNKSFYKAGLKIFKFKKKNLNFFKKKPIQILMN